MSSRVIVLTMFELTIVCLCAIQAFPLEVNGSLLGACLIGVSEFSDIMDAPDNAPPAVLHS